MNTNTKIAIFIIIVIVLAGISACVYNRNLQNDLANSGNESYLGIDGDGGLGSDVGDGVPGGVNGATGNGNNYVNTQKGFSINLPAGYSVDDTYSYQANPDLVIPGVKFTIPASIASGTNLSADSYLSVETVTLPVGSNSNGSSCIPNLFLDGTHPGTVVKENGNTYSVASSSGAGAGNRYEETVYAIQSLSAANGGVKSPTACTAVRYFIHYGAIQNYPAGTVKEFNKQALIADFDAIRKTYSTK